MAFFVAQLHGMYSAYRDQIGFEVARPYVRHPPQGGPRLYLEQALNGDMIYYDKSGGGIPIYHEEKQPRGMSEARDRKMKRERRFQEQKAQKVLRACRSRRGYELFQEQEKKK